MNWLRENWFWVAIAVLFLGTHMRGHGSHGGCGGPGHSGRSKRITPNDKEDHYAQH